MVRGSFGLALASRHFRKNEQVRRLMDRFLMSVVLIGRLLRNLALLRFLRTLARDPGPSDGLLLRAHQVPIRVRLVSLLLILRDRFGVRGEENVDFDYRGKVTLTESLGKIACTIWTCSLTEAHGIRPRGNGR